MENLIHSIAHIWHVIVESNTLNFIIFLYLFSLIFKKINVKGMIDSIHQKKVEVITVATKTKEDAHNQLKEIEKSIENLENELNSIISDATRSAEMISEKLLQDIKNQLENIEKNAAKVISAEEKMLISKLTHKVSKASVSLAERNIQHALGQNEHLHQKYINESIDELDRLNF